MSPLLRLPFYLLSFCSVQAVWSAPLDTRDADFPSVRKHLKSDHSGKKGDPPGKYFHESTFHPHYDGRFADKVLTEDNRKTALKAMLRAYLSTMNDVGAETWLMHGSLLGWWWNRKIMPWDSDVDVQVSERSMAHLANYYNMTVHHFKFSEFEAGRDYMLEINPNYVNGSTLDKLNMIDARWIDTETGLFIDITSVRRDREAEELGLKGRLMCKDKHHYLEKDIFPLRDSTFENTPVKIPYAYSELLIEEYGPQCLTMTSFENHHFDLEKMEWLPLVYKAPPSVDPSAIKVANFQQDEDATVSLSSATRGRNKNKYGDNDS